MAIIGTLLRNFVGLVGIVVDCDGRERWLLVSLDGEGIRSCELLRIGI